MELKFVDDLNLKTEVSRDIETTRPGSQGVHFNGTELNLNPTHVFYQQSKYLIDKGPLTLPKGQTFCGSSIETNPWVPCLSFLINLTDRH